MHTMRWDAGCVGQDARRRPVCLPVHMPEGVPATVLQRSSMASRCHRSMKSRSSSSDMDSVVGNAQPEWDPEGLLKAPAGA